MIKSKTSSIKDILLQFLREEGLETPLLEYRIVQAWSTVMGDSISKYTTDVYIQNGMLFVKLRSPSLKQNLMLMHKEISQKLNTYVGSTIISDVRFL